jgi:hypothetical protein
VRDFDRAFADLTPGGTIDSTIYGIWYHLGVVQYLRGDFAAKRTYAGWTHHVVRGWVREVLGLLDILHNRRLSACSTASAVTRRCEGDKVVLTPQFT